MGFFVVTVKLPKDPNHDPKHKIPGVCPFNDKYCTDVTGQHHSTLHENISAGAARLHYEQMGFHVTRVETPHIQPPTYRI